MILREQLEKQRLHEKYCLIPSMHDIFSIEKNVHAPYYESDMIHGVFKGQNVVCIISASHAS